MLARRSECAFHFAIICVNDKHITVLIENNHSANLKRILALHNHPIIVVNTVNMQHILFIKYLVFVSANKKKKKNEFEGSFYRQFIYFVKSSNGFIGITIDNWRWDIDVSDSSLSSRVIEDFGEWQYSRWYFDTWRENIIIKRMILA